MAVPRWTVTAILITTIPFLVAAALAAGDKPGVAPGPKSDASPAANATDDPALRSYFAANGLLDRGLYELAAAEYEKFLETNAGHDKAPLARYGLGICHYRTRHYDKAIEQLAPLQGISDFDYPADVGLMLGQAHLAMSRFDAAAEALADVVSKHGDHDLADDAAAGLIEALCRDGHFKQAVEQYEVFASRWPASPLGDRALYFAALARMQSGDDKVAALAFEQLAQRDLQGPFAGGAVLLAARCHHRGQATEEAIQGYRAVLRGGDAALVPDALLSLGILLHGQGDLEEAGALLDRLLDEFPDGPLIERARLERGHIWFAQGRFEPAAGLFRTVADDGGALREQATYWWAKCALRSGAFEEAAARLAQAIAAFPNGELAAEMCYDRSVALMQAGRIDAAQEALAEFRRRFPDHALAGDALHLLAAAAHRQGKYDASLALCEEFHTKFPQHPAAADVAFLGVENEYLAGHFEKAAGRAERFVAEFPDDARLHSVRYRRGMALYLLVDFDHALPALNDVVESQPIEPTCRPALMAVGDIHFQRSEWKDAQRWLEEYLSADSEGPRADDALLKLGLACVRLGKHEAALAAFDRLITNHADSPHAAQALFERGQVLAVMGRTDEAEVAFKKLLTVEHAERFTAYTRNHLGALALKRGAFEDAANQFAQVDAGGAGEDGAAEALLRRGQALLAGQHFPSAANVFEQFLRDHPSHARAGQAAAQLAIALAKLERCDEALGAADRVERTFAKQVDADLREAASYEVAWCLREQGDVVKARQVYRRMLAADVSTAMRPRLLLELGTLEEQAERYADAVQPLRELQSLVESATASVPADVADHGLYTLGVCELRLERFEEAAAALERLLLDHPSAELAASARFFCGEALHRLGRNEPAAKHLTRVVEDEPSDPLVAPAMLRLGEVLAALQHWPRAEQVFGEYVQRFGESEQWFQAQFGVGWAREHQQRYDEAIRAYARVVERHRGPTAARAQFQIGECLFAQEKHEQAATELLKVDILYAYPEWSAAALYEAGRCFEHLGRRVEARTQFENVVEKYKDSRWAALAAERLAQPALVTIPGKATG